MPLPRIDIDYLLATLRALLEIPSPTGFTDQIARHVSEQLEALGVHYELTRRGAVRARIPGQKGRYVAQRNYLILARRKDGGKDGGGDEWLASWRLEESGNSPDLLL